MRAWLNYSLRKLFGVNCEGSLIDNRAAPTNLAYGNDY